ncbi:hypothetical protein KC640_03615, partial [Candidatus Dojkabacteria bacterium]|nr:hypothetical protein [Candidatus Dojkabacteria bacterium]
VRFITLPAAAELEVSKYLLMVTPTLFFFLLLARQKSLGFWATVITIILSFHVILAAPLSMWVWIMSAVIGVAILVVLIMMTEFSVTDSLNSLRADIAKTLSSQISVAKVFQNNPVLSLIILFIAYLVLMTIVFVQGKLVFATEIADLAKDYQAAFAGITDVRTLLFGGGAVSNRVVVGLADIIAYNGLVGLVAYLLLWGSVIRFALERMLAGISEKTPQYEALILLPILLGLPLLAIFTAVPALGWWMWWISVAYLAADLLHDKRKVKQELLPTWKWRQNIKILAPIIQIIGILVIIITASALTRVITELFTQTTI